MSKQTQFNDEVLTLVPKTKKYILTLHTTATRSNATYVTLRMFCNNGKPANEMTANELKKFDTKILKTLKFLIEQENN